jgi:hypothetical protein
MKSMSDIKEMGKKLGVNAAKMQKPELIRAIQKAEGNIPCFATGLTSCSELKCCWRDECISKK